MGEDKTVAKPVEAPALKPLALPSKLAATPAQPPRYSVKVKNGRGEPMVLGDPRATRALVALMNIHAVNGGAACHWGGPAAFAEMMSAIHGLMFATKDRPWHEAFNFVNDAGHAENGIYALRANYGFDGMTWDSLKGFRSLKSKLTGHGESHLNPEGVLLSNGPLGSALPQAQGLAVADKMAGRDRVTICVVSDGASMEGEAKEAFAAIPGLAAKGKLNPFVMVLSDNDTKLSGRISADAFSMQPTFAAMEKLGWKVLKVAKGHNLRSVLLGVEKAIDQARTHPLQPVCVWIKTIKGYGVKATEMSASGGHGFPLGNAEKIVEFVNEIYRGKPPRELSNWALSLRQEWEQKDAAKKAQAAAAPVPAPGVKKDKIQTGLAKGAVKAAQAGYPVFSVSSDVQGSTGISLFQKSFPDRWIEVGVAEANMISTAAGLSKNGYIPIVDTFGQFGVTKGNLPLTMAALSQAPVIAVFSHVGFQDAADGASHQATTYIAATSAIPHTAQIIPSCSDEAEALMFQAIQRIAESRTRGEDGESAIFFVGRENYPVQWTENASYPWGKAQLLREGKDVVLIGCGPLLGRTLDAAKQLASKGIEATVINNPFVNQVDVETIGAAVRQASGRVVTLEDHQLTGGMGSLVAHALTQAGVSFRMKSLGIPGVFGQSAYLAEHLYENYGLTAQGLVQAAEQLMKG
ncbi:MAG TPA: transketolase C-terminal domain-containing protein [Candidatus Paceibacterota bacterium]|nr:transketolase C-terminal domain-containing protein [Verrucomicrobiota bacterium]HRY51916.1 transketolase C-terminal domain-containing protein [Candidatus Paceibacterota bacterium]